MNSRPSRLGASSRVEDHHDAEPQQGARELGQDEHRHGGGGDPGERAKAIARAPGRSTPVEGSSMDMNNVGGSRRGGSRREEESSRACEIAYVWLCCCPIPAKGKGKENVEET